MIKINTKVTWLFITIAVITSGLVAILALWRSRGIVEEEAIHKMLYQTKYYAQGFEQELNRLRYTSQAIEAAVFSTYPEKGLDSTTIYAFKKQLTHQMLMIGDKMKPLSMWLVFNPDLAPGKHLVSFYDRNRDGIYVQEEEYSINDMDLSAPEMKWWTDAIRYGEVWFEPYFWVNWEMELISYSKAIYIDSVFVGCIGSDFDFSHKRKLWGEVKFYTSGYFVLVDKAFKFIIHPEYGGQKSEDALPGDLHEMLKSKLQSSESGFVHYHLAGQDKVLAFQNLSNGWVLVTVVPLREIDYPIYQIANAILIILLAVILLAMIVAAFFSRTITAPVQVLVNLFNAAEKGNLSIRSTIKTNDELENLGERFNFFMSEMQRMIGQLKEQEKALIQEKERAEESDRLKTAFLGNLSHEIRTPLYGIVGYSELLAASEYSPEEKRGFIQVIQENNDKLLRFIEDILIFSQLEQGLVHCEKDNYSINALFKKIGTDLKEAYLSRNPRIRFRCNMPDFDDAITVHTDYNLLFKTLNILMDNAYKFTTEGDVVIGSILNDNKWGFYVEDSGVGIPQEYQELIFEKFYKYAADSSVLYEGVGMGLSIALDLVHLLGGIIDVKSEKGQGSTFIIEFSRE